MLSSFKLLTLPITLLAFLFSCILRGAASRLSDAASSESSKDLICHTVNRAECYPAIFIPTRDFQIIHDDQSIPPGLHVRMNLATGVKEARLNVPEGDVVDDSAVVVIDNSAVDDETVQQASKEAGAGRLDVQDPGHINQAFDVDSLPTDSRNYTIANDDNDDITRIASIIVRCQKHKPEVCLAAVEDLTELAHDLEWGIAITKDGKLSSQLWHLIESGNAKRDIRIPSATALLLGTALQNNEKALRETLAGFSKRRQPEALVRQQLVFIQDEHKLGRSTPETYTYAKRLVFLLSQLCTGKDQLYSFVSNNGLSTISGLFTDPVDTTSGKAKAKLLRNIVSFVVENTLDIIHQTGGKAHLVKMCYALGAFLRDSPGLERFEIESSAPFKKTLEGALNIDC